LILRLGTTDVVVFNDIYRGGEYGWNFPAPPRTIVDAGAYTGLSTAFFASRYPEAKIIAIEPSEQNFQLLERNTAAAKNVSRVRAALWSDAGTLSLTDPGDGEWGFRLAAQDEAADHFDASRSGDNRAAVATVTVRDVIQEFDLGVIDFLKLDIEGGEKEVFSNADDWIGQVDAICLELHDRFKAGCSRAFYRAIDEFPVELRRGEEVLVMRRSSRLASVKK
jgi:FkbM family methyltransferase